MRKQLSLQKSLRTLCTIFPRGICGPKISWKEGPFQGIMCAEVVFAQIIVSDLLCFRSVTFIGQRVVIS